jgi:hypothetical protein
VNFVGSSEAAGLAGRAQVDEVDRNHAHNAKTGQSFVRDSTGCWIDAKTGKAVPTVPLSGVNFVGSSEAAGLAGRAQVDEVDRNHAHNAKTGQSFVRVPCPPPESQQSISPAPPAGDQAPAQHAPPSPPPPPPPPQHQCLPVWKDAATGKIVASGPIITESGPTITGQDIVQRGVLPGPDLNRAFDAKTGRNFVLDPATGAWTDAATGRVVASGPVITESGPTITGQDVIQRGVLPGADASRAHDAKTSRNFVRELCTPASSPTRTSPEKPGSSVGLRVTPSQLEVAVLAEINDARSHPQEYARKLQSPGAGEASAFLEHHESVPPLTFDARLAEAAAKHAADQGPLAQDSHIGSDSSRAIQRMQRAGVTASITAEVISVGHSTASGVVSQLIIDPPGPNHPHRADLFDSMLKVAGVGCGPNKKFGAMCVIDLASTPIGEQADKNAAAGQSTVTFNSSEAATNSCWIDASTGEHVPTGPVGWLPGVGGSTPGGRFDNPDANHVHDSKTGRTSVRQPDGSWVDAETGQAVPTGPVGWLPGVGGPTPGGRFGNPDANHVSDSKTGRTSVRVPCPR